MQTVGLRAVVPGGGRPAGPNLMGDALPGLPPLVAFARRGGSVARSITDAGGVLMKSVLFLVACGALAAFAGPAWAHSGGLNAEGCHNDRKNGGYHCHRAPAAARSNASQLAPSRAADFNGGTSSGAYRNCTEARAAGAARVRSGEPGGTARIWTAITMGLGVSDRLTAIPSPTHL